jgi:CSLREA domain-containing protein
VDDQTVVNALGGNASDIGAVEAHNFEVNSIADTDDGLCRAPGTGNGCTLREAINAANTDVGAEVITFAPALTSAGPATITLLSALAALSSDVTIAGPGANLLTVGRTTAGGIFPLD